MSAADALLPCPFCAYAEIERDAEPLMHGVFCPRCNTGIFNKGDASEATRAWNTRAASLAVPGGNPPTVPDNMQDWAGMDGTTAFHLIERHADNWADTGKMMGEWLAANQAAAPVPQPELKIVVSYAPNSWDTFMHEVHGRITTQELLKIQAKLIENEADFFKNGNGDYTFLANYFSGQYGFEGRCELAPGWEFDEVGFVAAPLAASPSKDPT